MRQRVVSLPGAVFDCNYAARDGLLGRIVCLPNGVRGGLRVVIGVDHTVHDVSSCRLDVRIMDGPLRRLGKMVRTLFESVFG